MNLLPEIKFQSATHVAKMIEEVLGKTPKRLKPIVAAVLSLMKWEQNKYDGLKDIWSLGIGGTTCALCIINTACRHCSLNDNGCGGKAYSIVIRLSNKHPLIAALEQAVLYEAAQEFGRRCGEMVNKLLEV